jgi:carboxylesterase
VVLAGRAEAARATAGPGAASAAPPGRLLAVCPPPGRLLASRAQAGAAAAVMAVTPGAEPFRHSGGPVGVLLCHGFTGSPQSLRPWAEFLAEAGLSVSLPRLPGHGTTWQEMNRTRWGDWYAEVDRAFQELRADAEVIFVAGLSMGGCLALRLAEQRGSDVRGLVLVNPSVTADTRLFLLAPVLKLVVSSLKAIGDDIKKPGMTEGSYDRTPTKAAASLPGLWKATQAQLGQVSAPVLVFKSTEDHVVGPASLEMLRRSLPAGQLTVQDCPDSFHVATLDNDAEAIFTGSLEFIHEHSALGKHSGSGERDPGWRSGDGQRT